MPLIQIGFEYTIEKDCDEGACPFKLVVIFTAPALCIYSVTVDTASGDDDDGGGEKMWIDFVEREFRAVDAGEVLHRTFYGIEQTKNYRESSFKPHRIIQTTVWVSHFGTSL